MTVQTVKLMSLATLNTKSSANAKRECGFDGFLEKGSKSEQQPVADTAQTMSGSRQSTTATKKQQTVDGSSCEYTDAQKTVQEKQEVPTETVEQDATGSVNETDGTMEQVQESEALPEDVLAKILSVLNEIVTVFQDTLQIGEQQLLDAAGAIQFGVTDFFDPERIKELFLQVQRLEPTELLTNENLYQSLEQLQAELQNLFKDSGLEQLLLQDGLDENRFDLTAFSEQIDEYVNVVTVSEDVVQNAEVVIAFERENVSNDVEQVRDFGADNAVDTENFAEGISEVAENDDMGTGQRERQGTFESENRFDQATMFLQKLVSSAKAAEVEGVQQSMGDFELYDIARQIIDQVKLQIRPDNTRMELQLNPEHLGKVELEITSKNGELSARLNVQNDHVKEAVESQMQVLRETLEVQGLKVENIEVTVAEFGFRFQDESAGTEQQQQRQRRNGPGSFDETDVEDATFSDVSEVMKEMNGNSVDYVA